jgi:hypothetical protein
MFSRCFACCNQQERLELQRRLEIGYQTSDDEREDRPLLGSDEILILQTPYSAYPSAGDAATPSATPLAENGVGSIQDALAQSVAATVARIFKNPASGESSRRGSKPGSRSRSTDNLGTPSHAMDSSL